jgi:tetratricopeptide (TPR) repeat protein
MAENPSYPGNPALPAEAREKILSTFRHSLNLFKAGKPEDCAVGCDFILKLDPRFQPARLLLEKARNPSAAVDVAALESHVQGLQTPLERLGTLSPDRVLIEAIEAYADRRFDAAIDAANRVLSVLPGNTDAKEILDKATKKRDLQPHVENFRQRALFALEAGQTDEARLNFERMKSLDPEHPEVDSLSERILGGAAPSLDVAMPSPEPTSAHPPGFSAAAAPEAPVPQFDRGLAPSAPSPAEPPGASASGNLEDLNLDGLWIPGAEEISAGPAPAGGAPPPAPEPPAPPPDIWSPPPAPEPAAPPAPAAAAAGSEQEAVAKLIAEGDALAARGETQAAIESWSKVFLVDLGNAEAAGRIESARTRQAESTRRVHEALKAGRSLYESGQLQEAREKFLEALAIDENEPTARSFLQRVEEDLARPRPSFEPAAGASGPDILAEDEAPLPARSEPARAASPKKPPGTSPLRAAVRRPGLLLGGIAALLVAAIVVGVFLVLRPRSAAPPSEGRQPQRSQTVPPPRSQGRPAAPSAAPASPPASNAALQIPTQTATEKRAEAEAAMAEHRYIDALAAFNLCSAAYATDPAFQKEMGIASEKVQEITPAVKLYNDADYETALPILWRLYQADHANADVQSYLVRCYYNQGVVALQNGLFNNALKAFDEALAVSPNDDLAQRQRIFSSRYLKRSPDLMAKIYVKYLRPRP